MVETFDTLLSCSSCVGRALLRVGSPPGPWDSPGPCSSRPGAAFGGAGVWLRLVKEAGSSFPLGQGELALHSPGQGESGRSPWPNKPALSSQTCGAELRHGVGDLELQKRKMHCHSHTTLASLTHNKGQKQHPFPSATALAVQAVLQSLQSVLGVGSRHWK